MWRLVLVSFWGEFRCWFFGVILKCCLGVISWVSLVVRLGVLGVILWLVLDFFWG